MFKKWYGLRVGVTTLTVLWAMLALSLSMAHAGKPSKPPTPPPPPPVSYTIAYSPLPTCSGGLYVPDLHATGMNNHAQVVAWGEIMKDDEYGNAVVVKGEGYVWKWGTQEPLIPLSEMILNSAVVVPSAELQAMWDAENAIIDAANAITEAENTRRSTLDPPELPDPLLPYVAWPFGILGLRFENATINDSGQIAAEFEFSTADGGVACHAFRFTPAHDGLQAEFRDLDVPAGWEAISVQAINNLGNVVGVAEYGTDAGSLPVFWDCFGSPADPLNNNFNSTPELVNGRAWAINDSDQITGSILVGGAYHAFRYTPDAPTKLKDLGVLYTRNPGSIGRDINNFGHVAGWSFVTRPKDSWYEKEGTAHAFLATGEAMVDLGALTVGGSTRACWINDSGNVVGSARSASPDWIPTWFLYTEATGMLDLLTLINNGLPAGTTACSLVDINDYPGPFGQICGEIEIDGVIRPFVLTPNE